MGIERLLFPTKFRKGAFEFLKKLMVFKKVGLKEVKILHVVEKEKVAFDLAGYLKDLEEKLKKEAESKISEWIEYLKDDVKITPKIVVGIPEYEILAESKDADIVASGKPTSSFIKKLFFGSTTLNFIVDINKPTVLAKLEDSFLKDERDLYEKVVFATDGSDPCKRALEFLKSISPIVGKVELLSVANVERHEKTGMFKNRIEEYEKEIKASGVDVEVHLLEGKPSKEIVNLATYTNATMIVMGTTGKDKFEELVLGSTSHRVMEMSKIPITMVP